MSESNVISRKGNEAITKRITVGLSEDVEALLDKVIEKKEYETPSQAVRGAIRVAFGKGESK